MKILQVVPWFAEKRAGEVNVCFNLSRRLARRGHDVTVATTDFELDDRCVALARNAGATVIPFHCILNLQLLLVSPSIRKWLSRNIKVFDIVHLHTWRSFQNATVHYYAKRRDVPYVMQAHGSCGPLPGKKNLRRLFDWVSGNGVLADACKLIAVSDVEVAQYLKNGANKEQIVIVPNGVDISRFEVLPPKGQFRAQYGISAANVVLYLGRLHRRKGIDFLIAAFSGVIREIPHSVLVIAGPDEGYENEARKLVRRYGLQDRVHFVGFISDPRAAYRDADILVYPSEHEIFGLVPLEAVMCGTPVIVTEGCGCGDMVQKGNFGSVVPQADVDQLTEAILSAIRNGKKSQELVRNGRQYIEKNLAWESVVKQAEDLYEDCIRNT